MSSENSPYKIQQLKSFDKEIVLPTSKSHTNRALILGAIRGAGFKVDQFSSSTDVTNMIAAFKKIGLKLKESPSSITFINSFPECENETNGDTISLETGDGGTTNRFLLALLARGKKEYHLYPTEKMSVRPIEDLILPLKTLGVHVECVTDASLDQPWVKIKGPAHLYDTAKLKINCEKSTQFATALMLAFSNCPLQFEFLNLNSSETYLEMTSEVISKSLLSNTYTVPVDFSSLSYPAALAALMGNVLITNCKERDVYQADAVFLDILKNCGAGVEFTDNGLNIKKAQKLKPFVFDVSKAPDLFPTLVFIAGHIDGESVLSNLDVLKFKESDRLSEMMKLTQFFGVDARLTTLGNELSIRGKSEHTYSFASVRPARDHRIVMAAALFMAKNKGGELYETISVAKSYPDFLTLF